MMLPLNGALEALARGHMVVVSDDEDRENEGDLVMAAADMTVEDMVFYLRHGSGIVCATMPDDVADALDLPLMVGGNTDPHQTAFTVSVDHVSTGTGISAADRLATIHALADPATEPHALRRPGHVFPLRSRQGGVLKRTGHTEASLDLLQLTGPHRVGVITELVDDCGRPLQGPAIARFAGEHGLPLVRMSDLVRHRRTTGQMVVRTGEANLPTQYGLFRAVAYASSTDDVEHLALVHGDPTASDAERGTLVRVHSECLTGDLFGSARCDCGHQLDESLRRIVAEGSGVLVYLRGHEGRGIGLGHKLRAYALQEEEGRDTVDANLDLGMPVDSREYGVGAAILADLGVRRLRLLTNNPHKYSGLRGYDLEIVDRVSAPPMITAQNLRYLTTKRDRMGHLLTLPPTAQGA